MSIRITVDDAATYVAEYLLQGMSSERQAAILPATKYNVIVKAFNGSSLLLTAAAVSAVFLAFTAACVFLAAGLLLRWATEKEIDKYALPRESNAIPALPDLRQMFLGLFPVARNEVAQHIHQNVGMELEGAWEADEAVLFDYVVWKNSIVIPPADRSGIMPVRGRM